MKITPKILILKSLKPLMVKEWPNNYLNKI